MRTLLILRHAKSSWKDESISDHDRPLNKRGQRDAPRIGELLNQHELVPRQVFSSTALRAIETARIVTEQCGFEGTVMALRELYLAPPESYVSVLRHHAQAASPILVVGHNPGIESLVYALTGEHETMPTAALAQVSIPVDDWSQLGANVRGTLTQLWRPKEM